MSTKSTPWSAAELAVLTKEYPLHGAKHTAALLGRAVSAVHTRAHRLGLSAGSCKSWSAEHTALLHTHYPLDGPVTLVGLLPHTRTAIMKRAANLGIASGKQSGQRRWSAEHSVIFARDYPAGRPLAELAAELGRSKAALITRAHQLGMRRAPGMKPARRSAPKVAKPTPAPKVASTPKLTPTPKPTPAPKPPKDVRLAVKQKAKAQVAKKQAKPAAAKKWWHYRMGSPEYEAGLAATTAGKQRTTILDDNGRTAIVWRNAA